MTRCTLPKYGYLDTNLTTSAHFSGNLVWETIHVLCTNVLIPINWSGVFIKFLKEPWGNAVEVWVTSYSLHYLIWKYPKRTSANEEILRSVLLDYMKKYLCQRWKFVAEANGRFPEKSFLSVVWADRTIKSAFLVINYLLILVSQITPWD